jgi:hypothetical protein
MAMAIKEYTYTANNGTVYILEYEAEDYHLGEQKFSTMFPYDPALLDELGLTTPRKVARYIRRAIDGGYCFNSDTTSYIERYFNRYWSELVNNQSIDYWVYYNHSRMLDGSPVLYFNLSGVSRGTPEAPVLVGSADNVTQEPARSVFTSYSGGEVRVNPIGNRNTPCLPAHSIADRWTKLWNYTYSMEPVEFEFFRRTPKDQPGTRELPGQDTFGLELEISTALSREEIQYIVAEVEPKQKPFFIFKSDGSVNGQYHNLVELVTVPCTPRYLKREFKVFFSKLDKLAQAKGRTLSDYFDTRSNLNNGLHIHVSRDCFMNQVHMKKFLALWNRTDTSLTQFIQRLSGRNSYVNNTYCAPDHGTRNYKNSYLLRSYTYQLRGSCHERKSATVEVRVFQGIFDIEHVCRSIDLVDATVRFTNDAGIKAIFSPVGFSTTITNYIMKQPGLANLKKELKVCV